MRVSNTVSILWVFILVHRHPWLLNDHFSLWEDAMALLGKISLHCYLFRLTQGNHRTGQSLYAYVFFFLFLPPLRIPNSIISCSSQQSCIQPFHPHQVQSGVLVSAIGFSRAIPSSSLQSTVPRCWHQWTLEISCLICVMLCCSSSRYGTKACWHKASSSYWRRVHQLPPSHWWVCSKYSAPCCPCCSVYLSWPTSS